MLLLLDLMCVAGVVWAAALIGGLFAGVRPLPTAVAVIVTAPVVAPIRHGGDATVRGRRRGAHPRATPPQ